ncbi:response regulator transcription factor [Haloarcula sediminis]|uniref:response regulator transcription factor n=1 Tax=Haloarcula sediminis TaxID=3111777 RepID=UPI00387EDB51
MGTPMHVDEPRVLMVDDDEKVAGAYALRLEDVADVSVAYSGEEALDVIDDQQPPDVVLLDRHMPGLSGDEVLEQLRERALNTRIIMVTAIDPELGVLDLPFDDYLSKPVDREDLRTVVDQQCQILGYDLLGDYFQLKSTRALVEADSVSDDDTAKERLSEIDEQLSRTEQRVRDLLPEAEELLETFSSIDRSKH